MRVLFVSSQALFPGTRFGGAKRLHYLARELERRCDLTVLALDGNREMRPGKPCSGGFRRELFLPLDPPRPIRDRVGFLTGVDAVLERQAADIAALLGPGGFDATLFGYPLALAFLNRDWSVPLGRLVLTDDDLLLEQYRRRSREGSLVKRLGGRWRLAQARRFFADKVGRLSAYVCISPEEEAVVRAWFPGVPTRVLKYGVPLEEYPLLPAAASASVIGFIGNYRHPPNIDSLQWLLDALMPALRSRDPRARLVAAGRHLPEALRARCLADPAVTLMEEVEDLDAFYRAIGIFAIPAREGRGLRTKAVEAAAFGRPMVATPLGAEGLEELDIPRFGDAEGFATACLSLADPARWRAAAAANRRAAETSLSLAALGAALEGILAGAPARVPGGA